MHFTYPLHRAMQRHPDKLAVVFGERQWTYREFVDRVARLAGALRNLGMGAGDRVAMLSLNSARYLEYQFAVPWSGGVLNSCNIRWAPPEVIYSLDDSGTEILLVDKTFLPMVDPIRKQAKSVRHIIYCGDDAAPDGTLDYEALLASATPVADAGRGGADLAALLYTGGTTGFPKGVMLSHDNICFATLTIIGEGVARGGVYLHAAPMFHGADFMAANAHWWQGDSHVVIPGFNPAMVVDAVERGRVTNTLLVPTMIQMLIDNPAMQQGRDLRSLQGLIYGASPIAETLLERALAALPNVKFTQAYGMTEVLPATFNPPDHHSVEARKQGKSRSAGRAALGVELKICGEDGAEVPRGTVGEIRLRGPNMMQGYWGKPELTAAVIQEGWMRTGDGAHMDEEGLVYIVDRLKDMIVTGGENVYSAEVENAIAKHPGVVASAVIGIPSEAWGEAVHAVVVAKQAGALTEQDIIGHCHALIAGYKCPRSVSFVEALPISGAGKVLKHKLREPYWKDHSRGVA